MKLWCINYKVRKNFAVGFENGWLISKFAFTDNDGKGSLIENLLNAVIYKLRNLSTLFTKICFLFWKKEFAIL